MPSVESRLVEVFVCHNIGERKYLILRRSGSVIYPGLWSVCAGKIKKDESTIDAAFRELKEETGIDPAKMFIVDHVNVFYENISDSVQLVPVFLAESKDATVTINHEHSDYAWLNVSEAIERLHWVSHKKNIELIENCLTDENYFRSLKQIL